MGKKDYIIIGFLVVIVVILLVMFYNPFRVFDQKYLVIYIDDEVYQEIKLTNTYKDQIMIDNEYGKNLITIEKGYVWVQEADCNNQICVNSKKISEVNEMIVCLPHHLMVKIQGRQFNEIDAVSQ